MEHRIDRQISATSTVIQVLYRTVVVEGSLKLRHSRLPVDLCSSCYMLSTTLGTTGDKQSQKLMSFTLWLGILSDTMGSSDM